MTNLYDAREDNINPKTQHKPNNTINLSDIVLNDDSIVTVAHEMTAGYDTSEWDQLDDKVLYCTGLNNSTTGFVEAVDHGDDPHGGSELEDDPEDADTIAARVLNQAEINTLLGFDDDPADIKTDQLVYALGQLHKTWQDQVTGNQDFDHLANQFRNILSDMGYEIVAKSFVEYHQKKC